MLLLSGFFIAIFIALILVTKKNKSDADFVLFTWLLVLNLVLIKPLVSHYKHTDLYKSNYPEVKDGWYEPSVGGNYYYNLKGGYSFGKNDITIVAGKIISQDFKTKPLFPIFTQIGYNIKILEYHELIK
jgi:hypothetical protein